jgi:integral membrane protein
MEKSFRRYRVMSFVTGTTLLILFVCLILQHLYPHAIWDHFPNFLKDIINVIARVIGIGHGVLLYPIYMVMCFEFALRVRLNLGLLVLMLAAGFVPGLAFYMEHRVEQKFYPSGLPS